KLKKQMNQALQIPGVSNAWTMPIHNRINMISTGIKTKVGIKLGGPNIQKLGDLAQKVAAVIRGIPHTASVYADKTMGGHYLDYHIKRRAAARYGLTIADVQNVITTAIGGLNVTQTIE